LDLFTKISIEYLNIPIQQFNLMFFVVYEIQVLSFYPRNDYIEITRKLNTNTAVNNFILNL